MSENPNETKIVPDGTPGVTALQMVIPYPTSFVYSNCASFSISHMDIRIGFAEAMPDGTAEARVGVVMPPEHAAVLALMLLEQVHTYEKNFGAIRHPAWQKRKLRTAKTMAERLTKEEASEITGEE